MVTETELKEKLIAKISSIHDEELLHQISRIIDLELKIDEVYQLSPEEAKSVKEGLDQLDNGQWISNEEANKRADKWLKK